ncbi:MAG: type B 50S ribosomal protein L31 [Bacteroidetes bacterium]|jgi:large subunit ribosomal protein L31|nr:type B 50S ribosomal protein L31 [Bacteroidota bacterium]
MKADKHPKNYREVIFQDMTNGHQFMTRSCVNTSETTKWEDGNEYPLYKLEISNTSHPFFTGKKMLVDSAGRIEKFNRKFRKVNQKG